MAPGGESIDVTARLTSALSAASGHPDAGLLGPAGAPQGRVHLGPGVYRIRSVQMPDNVRIEIDPGATIRPVDRFEPNPRGDWGLFIFGTDSKPVRNVTITAGDGCGRSGAPTSANKPTNTGFRGNDPTNGGMANSAVPFNPTWHTDTMWVMDLDPAFTGAGVQMTGFHLRWAYDVAISDVFTIQNPARAASGVGPIPGVTSRTTAMMFDPPDNAPFVGDVEAQHLPHRVSVKNHYNILSPSGQGSNQVRACRDCSFESIFSHGGAALRVETDGIKPVGPDCSATGPDGAGFKEFSIVDGLVANRIEGVDGNRVVMFTPHCLPNGSAKVSDVRGTNMYELVVAPTAQKDSPHGSFSSIEISDVQGCGGAAAQEAHPDQDSYLLAPSRAAAQLLGPWVQLRGTWSWPRPGQPGGLADGLIPAGSGATLVPKSCPN